MTLAAELEVEPVPNPRNPLPKLLSGEDLPSEDARHLFERLVLGKLEPAEIAATLVALRMKGETVEEITGCARARRIRRLPTRRTPRRRPRVSLEMS